MATPADLERARACYARRAWADAFELFDAADRSEPLGIADLESYALAAQLIGRDELSHKALERVYQTHVDAGRVERAAYFAFWLGMRLNAVGETARGSGWLGRAERALEGREPCVVHGYLLMPAAHRLLGVGALDEAHALADRAEQIGETLRDPDLTMLARNLRGRIAIRRGELQLGLGLLDETLVAAAAGEVSTIVAGLLYCAAIASCQRVYALDRAREWTRAANAWSDAQPQLVVFTNHCLVYRAEVLQLSGEWSEARAEAELAFARCVPTMASKERGSALYQQAEIQRLRGDFAGAEQLYREAHQHGREPQPGLGLLRLAQGKVESAASGLERALLAATDPLERIVYLPAQVEVALARNELDAAATAAGELASIARCFDNEVVRAIADHAQGAVLLARGDARAAAPLLRGAFELWQRVSAPYLAARIRLALARACQALGDADGALLELDAAHATFEQLGARPDMERANALRRPQAPANTHGLSARELEVLRLVAAGKTNKAIAKELFLSEKTVDRHVSNIFAKLDVPTRAAATAFAYERGLI